MGSQRKGRYIMTRNEKENATEKATATEKTAKAVQLQTMQEGLLNAEKSGKSFKLFRSWYYSERKKKNYYSYNIYLRLNGTLQDYIKVELVPDTGFASKDEKKAESISKNVSAYQFMHMLYDLGGGIRLFVRSSKRKDDDGNEQVSFSYWAICNDGVTSMPTRMVPRNQGSRGFLDAAFVGFGKIREVNDNDISNLSSLAEEFKSVLFPGVQAPVPVEQDIE